MKYSTFYFNRLVALFLCLVFPLYLARHTFSYLAEPSALLSAIAKRLAPVIDKPPTPLTSPYALKAQPGEAKQHPPGLVGCINSLEQYPFFAQQVLQRKYARYARQTPAQRAVSDQLGYAAHFEKAKDGIAVNADFSRLVAQAARKDYRISPGELADQEDAAFDVVNQMFGHLVRDWSAQGAAERQLVIPPIRHALFEHFGGEVNVRGKSVLVPGSGMGRLASDLADLDFEVTANELDYGSILAHQFLTNHTTSLDQHTLRPFVTKWTHQARPFSRYSALTVPDHLPNKAVKLVEGDFLKVFPRDGQFDAVVTLFFIDISENAIDFLSNIHRLLKPDGVWINLGPLKWGSHTALQLSAEEVLQMADLLGFNVDQTSRKSIETLYAAQPDTLLKHTYVTQFWTATKKAQNY